MPKQIQQASIRPSASGFALVGADGEIVRDGFKSRALASMWGARQHLYRGQRRTKREIPIPAAVADEQIFGLPLLAKLRGQHYATFLPDAKAGKYGPLIPLGSRAYGIRFGDYRLAVAAQAVK